jgi:UDP-2-acetamido-2-deoxy-ribo-hexuluronate aminotransferase
MNINFSNIQKQYKIYKKEINSQIKKSLIKSNFILGSEVDLLEKKLCNYTKSKYCITCSSGTDALLLSLMAVNIRPGDEVITSPFSWISAAETIALLKAKPVFVDVEENTFNINSKLIENKITNKTKAIIPVNLFGQPADLLEIKSICKKNNLKLIIDGAQSFGSTYKNNFDNIYGDLSITSFFPSKPLGCYGDGGAIFTNNKTYAKKIIKLRNHGKNKSSNFDYIGINGRLDTLQASILLAKLNKLNKELSNRNKIAKLYNNLLNKEVVSTPIIKSDRKTSWAQYTLKVKYRNKIISKLKKNNIPFSIFYKRPLHLQKCFKYLGYKLKDFPIAEQLSKEVLSLPMNPFLSFKEIKFITSKINEFTS